MDKNILIIGLNSELAQDTIKELKQNNWNIYATSRQIGMMDEKVREFHLDVTNEMDFIHLKEKFQEIKFDVSQNFVAIAPGRIDTTLILFSIENEFSKISAAALEAQYGLKNGNIPYEAIELTLIKRPSLLKFGEKYLIILSNPK